MAYLLPTESPWPNPTEPGWMHREKAVVEPERLLAAAEVRTRVCDYYAREHLGPSHDYPPETVLEWIKTFRGCLHGWCRPWSSKPVGGVNNAASGFDSHTLPLAPANPRREPPL